ncbi:MAG: HEAT repeat domain-containing protein [Planctomycetes bacterium]|nr:HEAT repeat domain-containing protein [Planctomycetota bacterium]MBL7037539.1 HEAT repeat domain-containing protein [Pirellulaceae bacterium]
MSLNRKATAVGLVFAILLGLALPVTAADDAALDKAFEVLKTYDWGNDRSPLEALDRAIAASHGDAAAQKALEARLVAVLKSDAPNAAKDVTCRQLSLVGSAGSVETLADLLGDEKLAHIARYALERMQCPEALAALREALSKTSGRVKVGVINSLGVRRDAEATAALTALLDASDEAIVSAAAGALGKIGSSDTAKTLKAFQADAPDSLALVAADACLANAEQLLADGKKLEAMMMYRGLSKSEIKHIKVAATRGLLAAAGKK